MIPRNVDRDRAKHDRLVAIEAAACEIEQSNTETAETKSLEELAVFFCDAPIYHDDHEGLAIKGFLAALLKIRGKAMPEINQCSRCGVSTNGVMRGPHSDLCRNKDGTETELSDDAVRAAMKVLKRRSVESGNVVPFVRGSDAGGLDNEIPF